MANKVTWGLDNVHIAFVDPLASAPPEWETPIHIPGAVGLRPSVAGSESTFYADNGPYFVVTANNGYTAELEVALIPDAVLAEMLGWEIDSDGAIVELSDGKAKEFALMWQEQGDVNGRRGVFYKCTASRPAKERSTQGENVEVVADVLSLTISPVIINGKKTVGKTLELNATNATAYNTFFDAVAIPKEEIGG